MNTAAMTLKKIDLLNFIFQSETSSASLRMTTTQSGTHANVISFPTCGNWTNKPISATTPRHGAPGSIHALASR